MTTTVFISHQKRDKEEAKLIADYLKGLEISVYFDDYDRELQTATQNDDPKTVTNALKKGINNSTHMLCLISKNTLYSKWVPFEVGYVYDKIDLTTLTLKGIKSSDLSDYIKVAPVIRDIYDINKFIKDKFQKKDILKKTRHFVNYNFIGHPLHGVMDTVIT